MFRFVLSSSVGILLLVGLVVSPLVLWVLLLESRRFFVPLYRGTSRERRRCVFRCMGLLLGSCVVSCSVAWG